MTAVHPIVNTSNLETICLIWLDSSANTSSENIATQAEFRSIIHHFKTFSNTSECEQYIRQKSKYDRIFLIVNGRLGQEIVPCIHHYRQVFCIYVYCQNKERHVEWAKKFSKVQAVLTRLDTLINLIQSDYVKRYQSKLDEPLPINIAKTNILSDELLDTPMYYFQFLIDCLLQMQTLPTDIKEFINICLNEYYGNQKEISMIHEFEQKYTLEKLIWWYTQDSFVYRILIKAISMIDLDLLLVFGFLIRDLCETLQKYQLKSPMEVYHGQIMSIDELNILRNSVGQYLSINVFFSTEYDRKPIITSLIEFPIKNDAVRVLFEIHPSQENDSFRPFANITSLTCTPHQQQVLFMLGSLFQLVDVHLDKKYGIWIIKLDFTNLKKSYDENSLVARAYLIQKIGKNDEASKIFQRLIQELPPNHTDILKCYSSLGHLSFLKDNYDSSLDYYGKALIISTPDDPISADICFSIGCIFQHMNEYSQALVYYEKALYIWKQVYGDEGILEMAECLNNMGCVYEKEQYYSKALSCHQQALSISDKFHAELGSSYNNIGNIYFSAGDYNSAIENYNFALQEKSKSVSAQDPSLAATLRNIALAFEEDKNFPEALKYYEKVALIYKSNFLSTHINNIEIQEDIQRVSSHIKH